MPKSQLRKHTCYYELLDAIRGAVGCPLCKIEATCVRRYFESLLHESVNDCEVRGALARAGGYCPRHAHYLRSNGNGLGIAILYRDQVKLFLESLESVQQIWPNVVRRGNSGRTRGEVCPACRMQMECRVRYGKTLVEWVHDEEMRNAFEGGRGLCVPHCLTVLEMPMDSKTKVFLVEMQKARMASLLRELEEFCRKHDYRFIGEGFGVESDSWARAVKMMVGEEGIF